MVLTKLEKALLTFLPPNLPVDGFYSSLTHGSHQRPLAWSKRNMAIVPSWVPDKRAPGLMNPSIRMLSLLMCAEGKARLWDTAMEDISMFHGQSILTHILWNHSGNFFASIDEKGKIAIWANKKYLNTWLPIYTVEMHNPVICCEWINPDRMYVAKEDPSGGGVKYARERTVWSRNSLALVLLTSDGQLVAIHKPNGHYFTHITTSLPPRSGSENQIASRISHGAMISDATEGIQLAIHSCNSLPSTVNVYQIFLRFTPEVVFRCDAKAILYLSNPLTGQGSLMAPSVLHHLQWLPKTANKPFSIAVALADRNVVDEGNNDSATTVHYRSQVVVWDMVVKVVSFHPAFHDLSTRRSEANSGQPSLTFALAGEYQFSDKFVSTMTCIQRTRELVVGFSDGSIVGLDSQAGGLGLARRTHLSGFSGSKVRSPPVTLHSSPNGLCLMVLYLCGRISTLNLVPPKAAIADAAVDTSIDIDTLAQIAILAIVNEWDYTDIIAKVVAVTKSTGDLLLADQLMERMYKSSTRISGAEELVMNECAFLPQSSLLRRILAFQFVLFQSLPNKKVQFRATSALLQLFSLGEVFMGSCTSDPTILAAHMDTGSTTPTSTSPTSNQPTQTPPTAVQGHANNPAQLKFDKDTLWSLLPLVGWTLELCTVIFRELAMFLNVKKSHQESRSRAASQDFGALLTPSLGSPVTSGTTGAAGHAPTILCLLYHARTRRTLRNLLTLIEQYHSYLKNREQLYMRVIKSGGPVEAPPATGGGAGGGPSNNSSNELQGMSISDAFAMREIHITTLFQHVDSLVTRCPLKIGVVKSFLRDLANIGPGNRSSGQGTPTSNPSTGAGAGTAGGNDAAATAANAIWQEQSVLVKGVVPPAAVTATTPSGGSTTTISNVQVTATLAQARSELQMMTRRYPTLWEMNRLMFATIHWLDLEPAPAIVYPTRMSRRQKLAAIHPNRCRIDAVAAIRNRVPGSGGSIGGMGAGRVGILPTHAASHHYPGSAAAVPGTQLPSQGSSFAGSRSNSISSVSGMPKPVGPYTESPAELPSATQPFSQAFSRRASTMVASIGPTGATAAGVAGQGLQDSTGSSIATSVALGNASSSWFWGQEHGFDSWNSGDEGENEVERMETEDEEEDNLQVKYLGWRLDASANGSSSNSGNTDGDDVWEDDGYVNLQQAKWDDDREEGEEDDRVAGGGGYPHENGNGPLGEDIELPAANTDSEIRASGRVNGQEVSSSSLMAGSPFFSAKAQEVATRTLPSWTVFARLETAQILYDERNVVQGVLMGTYGGSATSSYQPLANSIISIETYFDDMVRVEAQSRKRRLGVDWIRKSKRYKANQGRGRRCIRCLQIATTTSTNSSNGNGPGGVGGGVSHVAAGGSGTSNNGTGGTNVANTVPLTPQTPGIGGGSLGPGGLASQDIAAKTLWYHNYDRSCICGGMWLEL
ncbi:mediator complex subunit [Actinomortierella wolfii]|nr:mediator complex subunit [Actinomortierella wolfii]